MSDRERKEKNKKKEREMIEKERKIIRLKMFKGEKKKGRMFKKV